MVVIGVFEGIKSDTLFFNGENPDYRGFTLMKFPFSKNYFLFCCFDEFKIIEIFFQLFHIIKHRGVPGTACCRIELLKCGVLFRKSFNNQMSARFQKTAQFAVIRSSVFSRKVRKDECQSIKFFSGYRIFSTFETV